MKFVCKCFGAFTRCAAEPQLRCFSRNLTWRDMQHIVVRAARPANLKAPDWTVNGAGRKGRGRLMPNRFVVPHATLISLAIFTPVSHYFGFGLMDAAMMVRLARSWKTVPPQHKCVTHYSERYRCSAATVGRSATLISVTILVKFRN